MVTALLVAAGVALLGVSWRASRARMRLADTPRSRCAAAFVGFNEVHGVVAAEQTTPAHFTGTPSAWWRATLDEEREERRVVTERDAKGNVSTRVVTERRWVEIDRWASATRFFVADETGRLLVDVTRATVDVPTAHSAITGDAPMISFDWGFGTGSRATGRYRETEIRLVDGDRVLVTGSVRVDEPGADLVLDGADGGEFLVTTKSEDEVHRNRRIGTWAALVVGCAAVVGAPVSAGLGPIAAVLTGLGAGIVVVGVGTVALHNRLLRVKEHQRMAWSLIDVQLERRHTLVPQLVAVVEGYAAHERAIQADLATARTRPPAELTVLGEAYPQLAADAVYARLARELAATENRIAGAREYFNEAVTIVRDRIGTFPGVLLARAARHGRFGAADLLVAGQEEAAAPAVAALFR